VTQLNIITIRCCDLLGQCSLVISYDSKIELTDQLCTFFVLFQPVKQVALKELIIANGWMLYLQYTSTICDFPHLRPWLRPSRAKARALGLAWKFLKPKAPKPKPEHHYFCKTIFGIPSGPGALYGDSFVMDV